MNKRFCEKLKITACALFAAAICVFLSVSRGDLAEYKNRSVFLRYASSACEIARGEERLYLRKNLKGECAAVENEENLIKTLKDLKAEKLFSESGENFDCEYYYSPRIARFTIIKDRRVNLHVTRRNGVITIGTPINFGSF